MDYLSCCLCSFGAKSENELETHIDLDHSDIFKLSNEDFKNKVTNSFFTTSIDLI